MSATIKPTGFYVEVAPGGPWLAQNGTVTQLWSERGIWRTEAEAEEAIERSLQTP